MKDSASGKSDGWSYVLEYRIDDVWTWQNMLLLRRGSIEGDADQIRPQAGSGGGEESRRECPRRLARETRATRAPRGGARIARFQDK